MLSLYYNKTQTVVVISSNSKSCKVLTSWSKLSICTTYNNYLQQQLQLNKLDVTITCYLQRPKDAGMTDVISWSELRVTRDHVMDLRGSKSCFELLDPPRSIGLYSRGFAHIVFELHAQLNWLLPQSSHRIIIHWYCLAFSLFTSRAPTEPHVIISLGYYC
jgi:hypothetical protein